MKYQVTKLENLNYIQTLNWNDCVLRIIITYNIIAYFIILIQLSIIIIHYNERKTNNILKKAWKSESPREIFYLRKPLCNSKVWNPFWSYQNNNRFILIQSPSKSCVYRASDRRCRWWKIMWCDWQTKSDDAHYFAHIRYLSHA